MTRAASRFQPQLTSLEDRTVMSSYYNYSASGSNYSYSVPGMPDFDQKRSAAGSTPGLPCDGDNYCVPTAATNVMAFLANHGHPTLMPGYGARNWQAASSYTPATVGIATMGAVMDTDPSGGTTHSDGADGLQEWLDAFRPGKFTSGYISTKSSFSSTVDLMTGLAATGVLVMPTVGWYVTVGSQHFRVGGHALTLTSASGTVGPFSKAIGVRDPATDRNSTRTDQSAFVTDSYTVNPEIGYFDGDVRQMERVNDLSKTPLVFAYLEGFYFVDPKATTVVTSTSTASSSGGTALPTAPALTADFAPGFASATVAPSALPAPPAESPVVPPLVIEADAEVEPDDDGYDTYLFRAGPPVDDTPALWGDAALAAW